MPNEIIIDESFEEFRETENIIEQAMALVFRTIEESSNNTINSHNWVPYPPPRASTYVSSYDYPTPEVQSSSSSRSSEMCVNDYLEEDSSIRRNLEHLINLRNQMQRLVDNKDVKTVPIEGRNEDV